VISSSGCISIGELVNNLNNGNSTYSGNGVSFNYPSNWQLSQNPTTGSTFSVSVFKYNTMNSTGLWIYIMPSNKSTQNIINNMQNTVVPNGTILSKGTLKIDGNTAYQVTCIDNNNSSSKMRYEGISFVKNGKMYSFLLQTPNNDFDKEKSNFDIILNSFKIQ
jgi:PsbP.